MSNGFRWQRFFRRWRHLRPKRRPPLILKHGNGYRILSAVSDAIAKAGWSYADGRAWLKRARRLTYEELLESCCRDFAVTFASSFSANPQNWNIDGREVPELELEG